MRFRDTKRKRTSKRARVFVYVLAVIAAGGGGYLLYDRIRRKKRSGEAKLPGYTSDTIMVNNNLPAANALRLSAPASTGTQRTVQVIFNPAFVAGVLYKAAQARNISDVLRTLKGIKSAAEYSSVNDYYKKQSIISRTIVTDLLDYAFKSNEKAKAQIRSEFIRMGLKVDSAGKWSLQGLRLYKDIITIRQTMVTDSWSNKIPVAKNTILGEETQVENGMTWFRSVDNRLLKVPTQDVKYT